MAENSNDIWKLLQEYNIEPPVNTFEKVWEIIVRQQLPAGDLSPARKSLSEIMEWKIFSSLQQYSISPPAFTFETIKYGATAGALKKYLPLRRNLLRAASVLIIAGIGAFFYFSGNHQKIVASAVGNTKATTTPVQSGKSTHNPVSDSKLSATTAVAPAPKGKHPKSTNIALPHASGRKISTTAGLTDQVDQLLTMVNYRDPAMKKFSNKVSKEKRIVFNQYSYINLSDEMVGMINEVYLKKSNGKPSRKARKTEKKFKKWKKQDEKYFDRGLKKNPADIIDLNDFLMKN